MVKNYIKKNNKIYEVKETEVSIQDIEYDIASAWARVTELQVELTAMNAAKVNGK